MASAILVIAALVPRTTATNVLPGDSAPVVTKSTSGRSAAWKAAGQRAWRDVERSTATPARQLTEARAWLDTYAGHSLESRARSLVTRLRFTAPQRQHVLRHSQDSRAYGVFLASGDLVTYGGAGAIKRWNVRNGALLSTRPVAGPRLRSLVVVPGTNRFAASRPGQLIWGSLRGSEDRPHPGLLVAAQLTLSPSGRVVAVPCRRDIVELDLNSETELRRFGGFSSPPTALAYSKNGERLALFTGDKGAEGSPHEFFLWDTTTAQQVTHTRFSRLVRVAAFGPSGSIFVGTNTGAIFELDGTSGEIIATLESTDDHRQSGELVHSAHRGSIKGLAFSHDGAVLYTVSQGGMEWARELRLWDGATRKPMRPPILRPYNLDGLVFSDDGERFAVATEAGVVEVWTRE